ncbi:hypothetical protein, partial [Pseudomonas aeruginosa]|uniref:hypothetical protein n=1 Tax=Pseudomonas aeruginosa TaxID=287 RepID=UPI0039BE740F
VGVTAHGAIAGVGVKAAGGNGRVVKHLVRPVGGAGGAAPQLSDERLGHSPSKRHYSVEISPKFLQNVETIPRKTCLCL